MASAEENKQLVRHVIETALNGRDFDSVAHLFAEDYVTHVPGIGDLEGAEGFKNVIELWHRACPDWHMTIEDLVAEGDLVANRFTTRGTNTGPLLAFPATGKEMVVQGQELHRIEDGKVAESWICDDMPGIFVQLGLMSPPALA
jgi:steroid delta-isomerase-like uncharacterized protein